MSGWPGVDGGISSHSISRPTGAVPLPTAVLQHQGDDFLSFG